MNVQELQQEKIEILRELANTNIQISNAKNTLFKLQEDKTAYLEEREKETLQQIDQLVQESGDIIVQVQKNYDEIHQFCNTISEYSDFLLEAQDKFQSMLETFQARNEVWDENVKRQYQELAVLRKEVEQDQKDIEIRENRIQKKTKDLENQRLQIESKQATLLASYTVEKDIWNKIQSKN